MKKPDLFRMVLAITDSQLGSVIATLQRAGVTPLSVDLVERKKPAEHVGGGPGTKGKGAAGAVRAMISEAAAGTKITTKELVAKAKIKNLRPPAVWAALRYAVEDKELRKTGPGRYVRK